MPRRTGCCVRLQTPKPRRLAGISVEKTLSDLGDKLEESEKGKKALEKLKETLNRNGSTEELKAGIEELEKEFFAVSEKLYSKSGAATEQEPGADGDGTYYNADFEDKTK